MTLRTRIDIARRHYRIPRLGVLLVAVALAAMPILASATVTWTAQRSGELEHLYGVAFANNCLGLAVGESTDTTGGPATIVRTTNGGRNWSRETTPLTDVTLNRIVFAGDSQHLWAVGEPNETSTDHRGTILRSFDFGASWSNQFGNAPTVLSTQYEDFEGLTAVSVSEAWVAASIYGSASAGRILHTSDRGATWTSQTLPDPTDPVADVFFLNNLNGYAVTDGGNVLHTTDGGVTWVVQAAALSTNYLERVRFGDAMHGVIVGDSGTEFYTTDGGVTWLAGTPNTTEDLKDIGFKDPTHLWIVGEENGALPAIIASGDGGKTFVSETSPVTDGLNGLAVIKNTNPGHAWAVGGGGAIIIRTTGVC